MKNRPQYAVASVDSALRLALLLRQEGPLRISEAAERLGVARSTAHRLLAMLVYRDFAEQLPDKTYAAGRVLRSGPPAASRVTALRTAALRHLKTLTERTGETSYLQVLVGREIRFVATVECNQVLKVGDREGRLLPARYASGGKALLAALPEREVIALFSDSSAKPSAELAVLLRELKGIRTHGFAINNQQTEAGVTAIGKVIRVRTGEPVAALSLAMPSIRFKPRAVRHLVSAISDAIVQIEQDIADLLPTDIEIPLYRLIGGES